jgi:hypothetical protein
MVIAARAAFLAFVFSSCGLREAKPPLFPRAPRGKARSGDAGRDGMGACHANCPPSRRSLRRPDCHLSACAQKGGAKDALFSPAVTRRPPGRRRTDGRANIVLPPRCRFALRASPIRGSALRASPHSILTSQQAVSRCLSSQRKSEAPGASGGDDPRGSPSPAQRGKVGMGACPPTTREPGVRHPGNRRDLVTDTAFRH